MARRKETIWQNDFSFGAVRPEAVERDDTSLINASVKEGLNTISLSSGQLEQRPGLVYVNNATATAAHDFEIAMGGNGTFSLVIAEDSVKLYDSDGDVVHSETSVDWTAMTDGYGSPDFEDIRFWVEVDAETQTIILGSQYMPQQVLYYNGSWVFEPMDFSATLAGAPNLPFWNHYPGVSIEPSALTGSITLTASSGIWTTAHEGSTSGTTARSSCSTAGPPARSWMRRSSRRWVRPTRSPWRLATGPCSSRVWRWKTTRKAGRASSRM